MHNEWENDWQYASSIQIIATIAALLHDIGKSTIGFQAKLKKNNPLADAYRHEWVSLHLFGKLLAGCKTDQAWLTRFVSLGDWLTTQPSEKWFSNLKSPDKVPIVDFPPLAQWVGWLIVSHHRLPPYNDVFICRTSREPAKKQHQDFKDSLADYYKKHFRAFDYWVKNPKSEERSQFWEFEQLVIHSPVWQKQLKYWTNKALNDVTLMQLAQATNKDNHFISDPFLLHLSRLCLMLGDHNYSSLERGDAQCVEDDADFDALIANTQRHPEGDTEQKMAGQTIARQTLVEHLLGVTAFTARFSRVLPSLATALPTLTSHTPLEKTTSNKRFLWQNRGYQLAREVQPDTQIHGFFGVNMSSTGGGKTIGNARIMYGLSDPKRGARFTIALGLRILTQQTGQSFRDNLGLNQSQLAVLVGGQTNKTLYELNQQQTHIEREKADEAQSLGSESSEPLLDEWLDNEFDDADYDALNLGTVIEDKKARDLLFSPIVTCTVDHLMQASECRRGGKYIAPQLRLLSSDLILDEPDDFDHNDLPALSRLVHLAGLFGARVLLSSATLTPDLVTGLFNAYRAGREHFNRSQNKPLPSVVCAWFDEENQATHSCGTAETFAQAHVTFTRKRESFLSKQPVRRKADILPLDLTYRKEEAEWFFADLGQMLIDGSIRLHQQYYQIDTITKKQVSVGLIRIAHINNITQIITELFAEAEVPDDVHVHLACYHSRQLLVLRNALETQLDRLLSRGGNDGFCAHQTVQDALASSDAPNHIFIVLATPVAEVGRDHDYDWAIVEPSSMRSIIQLAGRVWRHRPEKVATENNMLLLQYNLAYYLRRNKGEVFTRPGFEAPDFRVANYDVAQLVPAHLRDHIDARPRIIGTPFDSGILSETLSDLEHRVMRHVMNPDTLNYVNAYWDVHATANRVHTHLQQISPFRAQDIPQEDWLIIPNPENNHGFDAYFSESFRRKGLDKAPTNHNYRFTRFKHDLTHPRISPWLVTTLDDALHAIQRKAPHLSLRRLAIRYATVSLDKNVTKWAISDYLGLVRG